MNEEIKAFYEKSYQKPLLKNEKPLYYYVKANDVGSSIFMLVADVGYLKDLAGGGPLNIPPGFTEGLLYFLQGRLLDEDHMIRYVRLKAFL